MEVCILRVVVKFSYESEKKIRRMNHKTVLTSLTSFIAFISFTPTSPFIAFVPLHPLPTLFLAFLLRSLLHFSLLCFTPTPKSIRTLRYFLIYEAETIDKIFLLSPIDSAYFILHSL